MQLLRGLQLVLTRYPVEPHDATPAVEEILHTMTEHGLRRLPVIDGHDLVGIVSRADVAKNLPQDRLGEFVDAISSAPPNN
jgi:CBS domain-containing protein